MFLSTYMMKVDKKGRISVPASWRAHLSAEGFDGFIAFPSVTHEAIDARGIKAFEGLMDKLRADTQARGGTIEAELFTDGDNQAAHLSSIAVDVTFDSEGRLSLPPALKSVVGECEQVAFVGRHGFFQIWSDHAWAQQSQIEREAFRGRVLARRGGSS
jgi:MraZ protein